jgi:formate dehydrogenase subunit gamma
MSPRNRGSWLVGGLWLAAALLPAIAYAVDQPFVPNPPTIQEGSKEAATERAQPLSNAPTWREVRSGGTFITQVKGVETGVLVQSRGESWKQIRNDYVMPYGAALLLGVAVLIGAFYLWNGPIKVKGRLTGRKVLRLSSWDRVIHWVVALAWLGLAITGILLLFGKQVVIPLLGYAAFAWIAALAKNIHNFIGPLFLISAVLMFFTYIKRNVPKAHDLSWLAKGGGMFTGKHVPAGYFNAGEKIVFWFGLGLLTVVVSATGLILNFPNFDQGRTLMQDANIIHSVSAVLYIAMMMGHMYLGSIGMQGAYQAMRYDGLVDEQWAKEHHALWYEDLIGERSRAGADRIGGGSLPTGAPAQRL